MPDVVAARDFYVAAFGFAALFAGEVAAGQRAIHVGADGVASPGLWLMPATTPEALARVESGWEPDGR